MRTTDFLDGGSKKGRELFINCVIRAQPESFNERIFQQKFINKLFILRHIFI